ncbi:MAG: hypothetical protein GY913_08235 [Proteobacteria bacterium]|nr:hypothetical protein [Pseudomonadota bacterium]MCP4916899.1 hypothetical protein [Pseudomonadota bacterium]
MTDLGRDKAELGDAFDPTQAAGVCGLGLDELDEFGLPGALGLVFQTPPALTVPDGCRGGAQRGGQREQRRRTHALVGQGGQAESRDERGEACGRLPSGLAGLGLGRFAHPGQGSRRKGRGRFRIGLPAPIGVAKWLSAEGD